jgi:predicted NUDIX family NTP pyrophosphohydrolase
VLLVHPGGPFWARRDAGAWSIPKGEIGADEDPQTAARREFAEELGLAPDGPLAALGEIVQKGGKRVIAFALEGDFDPATLRSNTFELEWPPRSGKHRAFPEVDRAGWFDFAAARAKILPAQLPLLDRLEAALA